MVARRVLDVSNDDGHLACFRCFLLSLLSERSCLLLWNRRVRIVLRMLCVVTLCLFVVIVLECSIGIFKSWWTSIL